MTAPVVRARHLRIALCATAAVLLVLSLAYQLFAAGQPSVEVWVLAAVFFVTIAAGETWQLRTDARDAAPLALAASLAFALTFQLPGDEPVRGVGGLVILVAALGTAMGTLVRNSVRAGPTRPLLVACSDVALRVLVVGVVVILFRILPIGGHTLREYVDAWDGQRWQIAVVLLLLASLGVSTKLLLTASLRALRDHVSLRTAFREEIAALGTVSLSTVTTVVVVALAIEPLGAVAVPLFLVPLVLLQNAVARQAVAKAALRQTVRALSRLTELGGRTLPGHAARVAALAVPMGRDLGLNERDLVDLEYAALLHDIGQVSLTRPIPGGATTETSPLDQRQIAMMGGSILARTADLSRLSLIVAQQATPYRRIEELGDIHLQCRIIKVANAFDDLVGAAPGRPAVIAALERIHLGVGYEYDPEVAAALVRVLARNGRISLADLATWSGELSGARPKPAWAR